MAVGVQMMYRCPTSPNTCSSTMTVVLAFQGHSQHRTCYKNMSATRYVPHSPACCSGDSGMRCRSRAS
ncbi:hypothetical protein JI435_305020 [Parastagonospora nodorum SN15]|uniref:Uncharacterized protein n=1 Tax=Phaeosphaeria nodorum (strain SN15 / ATCC MYA-4574 / FGSC 10173) TaxID=321614 RepID=A0A7U2I397_PHANO|nr:hypothetical protein JI435_305020 [Parastagonospora nodorum SN15]